MPGEIPAPEKPRRIPALLLGGPFDGTTFPDVGEQRWIAIESEDGDPCLYQLTDEYTGLLQRIFRPA